MQQINTNSNHIVRRVKCLVTKLVGTSSLQVGDLFLTAEIYPHVGCVITVDNNSILLKNNEFEFVTPDK